MHVLFVVVIARSTSSKNPENTHCGGVLLEGALILPNNSEELRESQELLVLMLRESME
jgi:hypothetical protein